MTTIERVSNDRGNGREKRNSFTVVSTTELPATTTLTILLANAISAAPPREGKVVGNKMV